MIKERKKRNLNLLGLIIAILGIASIIFSNDLFKGEYMEEFLILGIILLLIALLISIHKSFRRFISR